MVERAWLTCGDPVQLLAHLNCPRGDRKLLLYAVACCREHWHLLPLQASRDGVEWAERYADGLAEHDDEYRRLEYRSEGAAFHSEAVAEQDRISAWADGWETARPHDLDRLTGRIRQPARPPEPESRCKAAYFANHVMALDHTHPYDPTLRSGRPLLSVALMHDVFGNPFRPVTFSPNWRTDTAVSLARQMYESRDFLAMPILADALQDAGCEHPDILDHCRGSGPHVRGCWVVDLVLGKS